MSRRLVASSALLTLGLLLFAPSVALADNCGSPTDCWPTAAGAAAAAAGVGAAAAAAMGRQDRDRDCDPVAPSHYGLPPEYRRTSEYGVDRVYLQNGHVYTVPDGSAYQVGGTYHDPVTNTDVPITQVRPHRGVDYAAPGGESVPFTAGVEGTVVKAGGGDWNGITVRLDDGTTVTYLHAADVSVSVGDRVGPDTVLGDTGSTGANNVHLHVQAKDKDGNWIDPDCA